MENMEAKAVHRSLRMSPFRVRLVVDLVRGKKLQDARDILENSNKRAAKHVLKVVNSAAANAVENLKLNEESLYIKDIRVDQGATLKRYKFDSRGRIGRKDHRSCHITAVVAAK